MDTRIWYRIEPQERWADVLMLRGQEIWTLSVIREFKGLQHKIDAALEALQSGQDPHSLKAMHVKTVNAQEIAKADLSPKNDFFTLYHGAKGTKTTAYTTADKNAATILQVILERSGKTFQPVEVPISPSDAVVAPVFAGIVAAVLLALIYANAGMAAGGKPAQIEGRSKFSNFLRLLDGVGRLLGPTGTIAVGVVVLIGLVFWGMWSVKHRGTRTVWMPAQSATN